MTHRLAYLRATATLAVAAVILVPGEIRACSIIPCARLLDLEPVVPGPIPFGDGAIALRPVLDQPFADFFADTAAQAVTITVTPTQGGAAVPGEVVGIQDLVLLVWRPSAPLLPGTEYTVHAAVDNTMLEFSGCAEDNYERTFMIETSDVESVALTVPALTSAVNLVTLPVLEIASMVCCDGAFPILDGASCGPSIAWSTGTCVAAEGFGVVEATVAIGEAAITAGAGQIAYQYQKARFLPDVAEAVFQSPTPVCGPVTAMHLKTGETMTGPEVCVGQELADVLGARPIDPTPGLTMCAGEPYTCAIVEDDPIQAHWDSMRCAPWPEGQVTTGGEPTSSDSDGGSSGGGGSDTSDGASAGGDEPGEKGCACAANSGASDVSWVALGLTLLLRRRRRG